MGSSRFQRTKVVYSCKTSLVGGPLLPYCHYTSGKVDNKFLSKLSLKNDDEHYIIIEVGNDPHMVILNYRSPLLRKILSTNKKKNVGALMHIKLPNILPENFQIVLRNIYGGRLLFEKCDN
ncbi:hypothetical protein C1645_809460 [Glomus cerebriforme]|uniref:BTB domain-containing protein n=1 Tax=Glomus cerebriforme TaxID=658196 RepID=A0A397SDR6_9GLOM|nr:hypothetical protein C1645_809460 [Glomus cerebriforme]